MFQQITITAETPIDIRPLIRAAIQGKLKVLAQGINRTRERLAEFEKQYGMSSAEFERRLAIRELGDSLDFTEWQGEIKTLRLLEEQQHALQLAQLS